MKTESIHYGNSTSEQKEYIKTKIEQELGCCQSSLIDHLLQSEVKGFSVDDIQNLYEPFKAEKGGKCGNCGEEFEEIDDNTGLCQDCFNDEQQPQEIFEWWPINSDFLKNDLIEMGEPVLSNDFGDWWGRTCTGQAIVLDPTFWRIFQDGLQNFNK